MKNIRTIGKQMATKASPAYPQCEVFDYAYPLSAQVWFVENGFA